MLSFDQFNTLIGLDGIIAAENKYDPQPSAKSKGIGGPRRVDTD